MAILFLPQQLEDMRFIKSNFTERTPPNLIESTFEDGSVFVKDTWRKLSTNLAGSLRLSLGQLQVFKSFYTNELKNGFNRFHWSHPIDGGLIVCRIVGGYDVRYLYYNYYLVDISIEVIDAEA